MAFSFLSQELAIDLGTANTVIFQNDQIVLDEPSIVAIDNQSGSCIALGQKAKLMHERTNPGIKTVRPLKDGVIADFNAAEMMIRGFIKQVNSKHKSLFAPSLKVVVGIPSRSVTPRSTRAGAMSTLFSSRWRPPSVSAWTWRPRRATWWWISEAVRRKSP